jgi:hypothetical protein
MKWFLFMRWLEPIIDVLLGLMLWIFAIAIGIDCPGKKENIRFKLNQKFSCQDISDSIEHAKGNQDGR